ncbi:MAG: hypothetical protein JWM91_1752 [Rhodospirillales bacterium]|nr:hypothetical protein [Rhodospirillales bacterium]
MAIVYSSLMLRPDGLHYVAICPAEAWSRFKAITYVSNASHQRPDWIASMAMAIPLTYFLSGALAFRIPAHEARAGAVTLLERVALSWR